MPLNIIRQDITRLACDAIVNATDPQYSGSGGVDGSIHRAAGPALRRACDRLSPCPPGKARITKGYSLPSKYVIHTVGPVWRGGGYGEEAVLRSCYRESLRLAKLHGCRSVAFPPIATETLGYPKEPALRIATDEIVRFLEDNEMQVTLVVFGQGSYLAGRKLFAGIAEFIDQHYVDEHALGRSQNFRVYDPSPWETDSAALPSPSRETRLRRPPASPQAMPTMRAPAAPSLPELLRELDESFSQMLLRKIDEKGMTDAQCYKKANIDRKLFSKIRKDKLYRPSKPTAVAFAVALELPLEEAKELLAKAGFALSRSSVFDVIVEYFIRNGNYNIYEINEALFDYDQSLLGG